jgi:hypothetical protein
MMKDTGAFFAAVLEYLCTETLELGTDVMRERKMKTLKPAHISEGVRQDEELAKMFYNCSVAQSGVMHNIDSRLMPKKGKNASQAM